MLLLLPPSEGKLSPAAGGPVDLDALVHPELAPHRRRVGDALVKVSGQKNALEALGVGASLADALAANTRLWTAPAGPAHTVYTGVLYDAAGAATWPGATLARADERVRIFSAAWGALRPSDRIPAYRLSMGTSLGRIGPLASFWRGHLAAPLGDDAGVGLVVDCRSSDYVAAWRPGAGADWVTVRVERELDGKRQVVSHMAKHTRGLLAAHLLAEPDAPGTAEQLRESAATLAADGLIAVELGDAPASGPRPLTIVLAG